MMAATVRAYTLGITPHPVPLPQGEGTVWHAPSVIQAFPLPEGEGQGEGLRPKFFSQTHAVRAEPA
jgi:hypothetical protein